MRWFSAQYVAVSFTSSMKQNSFSEAESRSADQEVFSFYESSDQSSWLQIQRSGLDSLLYQIF
jgi:hypothetical protein